VPKRIAIISAGVIMNVIFAFVMAAVAFCLGVEQMPCVVGEVIPGDPAWQADLRVGDKILEIAGKKMMQFRDLVAAISLGDIDADKGVPVLVRRPGVKEPLSIIVKPDCSRGQFIIGVRPAYTPQLTADRKTWLVQKSYAVLPGSVADLTKPAFHTGDKIVQIDEAPIKNYAQISAALVRRPNRKLAVTVARAAEDAAGRPTGRTERLTIQVAPNPMRTLGLVMKMGEVTALQAGSPAVAAGIRPGDLILKVEGKPVADPLKLPEQLNKAAGQTVNLTVQRNAKTLVVPIRARQPVEFSPSDKEGSPVDVASLGIAYQVLNQVDHVLEGSPAAKAGISPEDVIVRAKLIPPDKEILRKLEIEQSEFEIPFSENSRNWPFLLSRLQFSLPGTSVELTVSRAGQEQTVVLQPVEDRDWCNPERGFLFEPMTFERKAASFSEACALGGQATLDELTVVFRTVRALGTSQISPRKLGGPWLIITALAYADQGYSALLIFLTMLSANLAVLNFLPIPVLDGGHIMFLAYEGIAGKPANERVQVVLTYIGLVFIIGLMVWVCGLDFGLISRR
jgi:regulator of sigma E protease